jgi:hypothetical protein
MPAPLKLISSGSPMLDDMKPGFQCVRTTSIRGFIAFGQDRGTRATMLAVPAGLKSDFRVCGAGPRPAS